MWRDKTIIAVLQPGWRSTHFQQGNKGFLPLTRDQYLSLLDVLGRVVRIGKRGVIPSDLAPILERLNVEPRRWLDSLLDAFRGDPLTSTGALVSAFT